MHANAVCLAVHTDGVGTPTRLVVGGASCCHGMRRRRHIYICPSRLTPTMRHTMLGRALVASPLWLARSPACHSRDPCRCDIIAADGLSARPRPRAGADNEGLLPAPLPPQDPAARGEVAALHAASSAVAGRPPQRAVCSSSGKRACARHSRTQSVGLSERSRCAGCTSPASARALALQAR
jgi:hypothetical protein